MAITLYTGSPGHGKTTALADQMLLSLKYSQKIFNTTRSIRKIYTNIKLSDYLEELYPEFIVYYQDILTMPDWRDCDIFIDEMSLYFDSQNWEKLSPRVKRFMRLHRHYGVNIYGAVQDFVTIDVTIRRLTTRLYHSRKLFSTREPSPHLPDRKYPFSFTLLSEVEKSHWELEKEHYKYQSTQWVLYTKKNFNIFNTREDLPPIPPPPKIYNEQQTLYYQGDVLVKQGKRFI